MEVVTCYAHIIYISDSIDNGWIDQRISDKINPWFFSYGVPVIVFFICLITRRLI